MKRTKIIFWASTIFIFLFEGIMPLITLLFAPQYITAGTSPLGYPDYFAVALAIFKVVGALAILLPSIPDRLKEWAYVGLTFNLIFAMISHAVVDGNIGYILMPAGIMAILALSYFSKGGMQREENRKKQGGVSVINQMA